MAAKTKNQNTKTVKTNKASKADSKSKTKDEAKNAAPTGPQRRRSPEEAMVETEAFLDDKSRRDIGGVVFIILAVIALALAVVPSDALVSGVASEWVHLLFGIGCYILPVVLLAIAISFFWRFNSNGSPARITLGFTVMYIAVLAIFALFAPIGVLGEDEPSLLFEKTVLANYGGYIGSALSWAGIVLLGRVITAVILAGLIIIGGIIVGFSISSTIDNMRSAASRISDISVAKRVKNAEMSGSFARVRQQSDISPYDVYQGDVMAFLEAEAAREDFDPNNTAVLGAGRIEVPDNIGGPAVTRKLGPLPANLPQDFRDELSSNLVPITHDGITGKLGDGGIVYDEEEKYYEDKYDSDYEEYDSDYEEYDSDYEEYDSDYDNYDNYDKKDDYDDYDNYDNYDEANVDDIDEDDFEIDDIEISSPFDAKEVVVGDDTIDLNKDEDPDSAFQKSATGKIPAVDPAQKTEPIQKVGTSQKEPSKPTYKLPPMSLLQKGAKKNKQAQGNLEATANALQTVLSDFGIDAKVVEWIAGPTVTLFEVDLPAGVRVSRVTALNDDIALALASPGVRIFAPVPGTNYVGIEVPNSKRETVLLSDVLMDAEDGPLQIAIGKDVEGNSIVSDLAKMPHLLIGGTTGSGKSVSINAMIMSILMRATPDEVRFIMIDPKRVEFTPYNGIPHLYVPVVTEPPEAASALAWGVAEMERRLKVFSKLGVRNIGQYNKKVEELIAEAEAEAAAKAEAAAALAAENNQAGSDEDTDSDSEVDASGVASAAEGSIAGANDSEQAKPEIEYDHLPYIVIVIDELADLMMNIGKEVEISISRIAQLARAAGIHLIVATQRPSTNVVTGLIKANITNRIAFNVASGIDSRVILDNAGAESLIGLGDMLLSKPELAKPQRIQACFVTEEEIFKVVDFAKKQAEPEYHGEILSTNVITIGSSSPTGGSSGDRDPFLWEAAEMIVSSGMGSTSNIQRRLKVGYARAGRIMDQLEELGIVGPANGSKPREVYLDALELESLKALEMSE